jgi:hypothetical protein
MRAPVHTMAWRMRQKYFVMVVGTRTHYEAKSRGGLGMENVHFLHVNNRFCTFSHHGHNSEIHFCVRASNQHDYFRKSQCKHGLYDVILFMRCCSNCMLSPGFKEHGEMQHGNETHFNDGNLISSPLSINKGCSVSERKFWHLVGR